MTRNINNRIAIILTAVMAASCTLKEDRQPCPCWLDIDITGCAEHTREVHVSAWEGDSLFLDKVTVADYPDVYQRTITKGVVNTAAFCGLLKSTMQGRQIIIPAGCQADQIRAHAALVDCTGESARDSVELYRQYAKVNLSMKGQDGEPYPYEIEVIGDVCGIDYVALTPVEGEFRYRPQAETDGTWTFRLPRQESDSRVMVVIYDEDIEMDRLPLYEWINRSGYSWLDRDLKEINIGVDYAMGKVTVDILEWDSGNSWEIEF